LRAGESEVAVLAQPKKRPSEAVARAGGFRPRERAKEAKRDSCRGGWSCPRSGHDQSPSQTMLSSAGNEDGAVLPEAKKRRPNAVAREAGFRLREQAKEGKRDS
jgi:hypothetical protein